MKTNLNNSEHLASEYDKNIRQIVQWMNEYVQEQGDRSVGGYCSFLRTGGIVVSLTDFDSDPGRERLFSSNVRNEDRTAVMLDLYIRNWDDIDRNASALDHSRRRALEAAVNGIKLTVEVGRPGDSVDMVSPLMNYELLMPEGAVLQRPSIDRLVRAPLRLTEIHLNNELVAVRTVDLVLMPARHEGLLPAAVSERPDELGYLRQRGSMDDLYAMMKEILMQALHHIEAHPDEKVHFRLESKHDLRTICGEDLRPWPEDVSISSR